MDKKKVVFLADIAGDIDDMVAIDYLHRAGRLDYVVLDSFSRHFDRECQLARQGIVVKGKFDDDADVIFCGGAFTRIAEHLKAHKIELLVANGFFAGCHIVPPEHVLPKFKDELYCRSYNPGLDWKSAFEVLGSSNLEKFVAVSKNVCHHPDNVYGGWHTDEFLKNYDLKPGKRLHDLLMVKEGLLILDNQELLCEYKEVVFEASMGGEHVKFGCMEDQWHPFGQTNQRLISIFKK